MKKFVTIGLSAIFGLACLGAAACGENGGGDGASFDHVALVSDKIETDEEWDRAMRDTLTALTDFEGEDDPTKTYDGWWYPGNDPIYDYAAGNYKVEIYYTGFSAGVEAGFGSYRYIVDGNKMYCTAEENERGESVQVECYMEFAENGEKKSVGKQTANGTAGEWEADTRLGRRALNALNDFVLRVVELSHVNMWWEKFPVGNIFSSTIYGMETGEKDYRSILEVMTYDEEKGGYTVADSAILNYFLCGNGIGGEMKFAEESAAKGCTFKFKDGKLAAVLVGDTDYIKITYGGQKVEFPNGLPW